MDSIISLIDRLFGKEVTKVKDLPGEVDLNYKIETGSGASFILKMAHESHDLQHLEMENAALEHLSLKNNLSFQLPTAIPNKQNEIISHENGRNIRLLRWLDGKLWSGTNPHSPELLYQLGKSLATLHQGLSDFDHPKLHRAFDWDPAQFAWVIAEVDDIFPEGDHKSMIYQIIDLWKMQSDQLIADLPKSCCYLDANDNNIIVDQSGIKGFIDFGDITYTHRINELAVCLAYACMGKNDPVEAALPIIRGFNKVIKLDATEVSFLHAATLARLAISVSFAAKRKAESAQNPYLNVSEQPAWTLIKQWMTFNARFVEVCYRNACGMEPAPNTPKVIQWINDCHSSLHPIWQKELKTNPITVFDWSVGSTALGNVDQFHDIEKSTYAVFRQMRKEGADIGIGRYNEPRPVYSTLEYARKANDGPEWRTVHLGIDVFLPAGAPLFAPLDGEVVICYDDAGDKEYGPLLVLKHKPNADICFYTLYGHNDPELLNHLKVGDLVAKGDRIALIGNYPENGNWVPHSHFQIMTELFGYTNDFPGVAYPSLRDVWLSICPDPNIILGLSHPKLAYPTRQKEQIVEKRKKSLGPNLSVSYRQPLHITRGYMQYLYAENGRRYLDTVNNVPHVGHQHPRIVRAAQEQMAVLNTNTRYLHNGMISYAEALLSKLPSHLEVIYFVNSGSEANELALRLAKNYSEREGVIGLDYGYHGNSGTLVGLSAYKCNGPGGTGPSKNVAFMPVPDPLRNSVMPNFKDQFDEVDSSLFQKGFQAGILIHETILSCGGQLVMPQNFFDDIYAGAKEKDIVTIADEVQTGFGRVGKHFWSFELYDILPDIVTMGKPIGNGHPLGAVATTRTIAEKFHNGMEYFATFGGNPVSCVVGHEVLHVIEDENLQDRALQMGELLKRELIGLQAQFPVIADVRGEGLFLGVELIGNQHLDPAADKATYILNRMKEKGILMSSDGPHHNVLKIKPPMCFSENDAGFLITMLKEVLEEDYMSIS